MSSQIEFRSTATGEVPSDSTGEIPSDSTGGIPSDTTDGIPLKTFWRKAIGNYRKLPYKYQWISSEKADIPPIITTINADKRAE